MLAEGGSGEEGGTEGEGGGGEGGCGEGGCGEGVGGEGSGEGGGGERRLETPKARQKVKDLREGQASGGESRVRRGWRAQGERAPPNPRARVRSATAHLQPFCNSGLSTRNTLSPTQSRRPARGLWGRVGAARAHGRWRAKWGRAEPDPRARFRGRPAHLQPLTTSGLSTRNVKSPTKSRRPARGLSGRRHVLAHNTGTGGSAGQRGGADVDPNARRATLEDHARFEATRALPAPARRREHLALEKHQRREPPASDGGSSVRTSAANHVEARVRAARLCTCGHAACLTAPRARARSRLEPRRHASSHYLCRARTKLGCCKSAM